MRLHNAIGTAIRPAHGRDFGTIFLWIQSVHRFVAVLQFRIGRGGRHGLDPCHGKSLAAEGSWASPAILRKTPAGGVSELRSVGPKSEILLAIWLRLDTFH